jgi:adenylate cyclase
MNENTEHERMVEDLWRRLLMTGDFRDKRYARNFFKVLPGNTRCKVCYVPFEGSGGYLSRHMFGRYPSNINPRLCNTCEEFARKYRGGVEIELTLLFADVRGSTTLAEHISPTEFSKLINRFYIISSDVLSHSDALIDKIIGDQAAGIFVPGFAGPHHARRALAAAITILKKTGHGTQAPPWIPLGVGIHTGVAFVGSLGVLNGNSDVTVLGDVANTAARLSSSAKVGEILISQSALNAIGRVELGELEQREVKLKGKSEDMLVNVLTDFDRLKIGA